MGYLSLSLSFSFWCLDLVFSHLLVSSSESSSPSTPDADVGGQLSSPLRKSFHRRTSLQPLVKSIPDLRKGIININNHPPHKKKKNYYYPEGIEILKQKNLHPPSDPQQLHQKFPIAFFSYQLTFFWVRFGLIGFLVHECIFILHLPSRIVNGLFLNYECMCTRNRFAVVHLCVDCFSCGYRTKSSCSSSFFLFCPVVRFHFTLEGG
jgi:hypothetical protein